jgi:alpha-galactosidase
MHPSIITVIGAASTTFGPKVLRDMLNHPQIGGCTFRFVDINAERLAIYETLAHKVNRLLKNPVVIESTTDRRAALPDSDVVIISVDTGHYTTWQKDFSIPVKHGIRQIQGELGGPGGFFHSLRQIPLHLAIGHDIAELCPQALVMVASNPLNRICLAMERHTAVGEIVGLCHGVEMALYLFLNRVMEIDGDEMEVTAAGTNHLTWILDLRRKSTGEDLYPLMRRCLAGLTTAEQSMSRKLLDVYGYFLGTLDSHAGEYIPYAHEFYGTKGMDFGAHLAQEGQRWRYLADLAADDALWDQYEQIYGSQAVLSPELRLDAFFAPRSWADTLAFPIIAAMRENKLHRMPAINSINRGAIPNLPADIFVETPAVVDASGIRLLQMGELPAPLAAFNRRDIDQMELTVAAGVSGDRRLALQAMLLDPVVDSVIAAERILDEMLQVHAAHLPQFQ